MTEPRYLRTIADLGPGDHLCCIYETEEEHRAVLTPLLREGLERGQKVLYVVDAQTAEAVLGYLRDDGLDVEPYLARQQLTIVTSQSAYMQQGVFDPDEMIAFLRAETERALAEGHTALRATGEMSWALGRLPGSERLMEYEAKLNEFSPGSDCLVICQYDRRTFPPALLLDVLCTHPVAVIGTGVYDNPYYVPPAQFLGGDPAAEVLHYWLEHLAQRKRAEEALREEKHRAQKYLDVAQVILVSINSREEVALVNEKGCSVLGYEQGEIVGKNWFDTFLPATIRQKVRAVFRKLMAGEIQPVEYYENPVLTKPGEQRLIAWHNTLLTDEAGNILGTLSSGEDITERKRAEKALQKAREDIEGRVERRTQEVNGYGLTFRELTVLHLVAAGESDKEIATVLGISPLTAHKHLANILEKMGAASRTEAGVRALREGLLD